MLNNKELPFKIGDILLNTQASYVKIAIILNIEFEKNEYCISNCKCMITYFHPFAKSARFQIMKKTYIAFGDIKNILNNSIVL